MRAFILGSFVLLAACGGGGGGSSCPNDLPNGCQSPTPSYQTQVAPIIQHYCLQCHVPGGVAAPVLLNSYQGLSSYKQTVLDQVFHCLMPAAPNPAPNSQERQILFDWILCGAPNN